MKQIDEPGQDGHFQKHQVYPKSHLECPTRDFARVAVSFVVN